MAKTDGGRVPTREPAVRANPPAGVGPVHGRERRPARRGALVAALTAIALGGLQLLQGAVGSFNPSWLVKLLIATAGVCATAAVTRHAAVRKQRDERDLREQLRRRSLRIWPLRSFEAADAQALGVFPARRDVERTTYVARAKVDGPLRAALRESALVVVIGPPRAGKSRTALEAARAALGDVPVLVPRDAASLRRMLPPDELDELGDAERRVLWLDGLERYIGLLDPATLEELGRPERRLTIVATVRERTWRRLLTAEGAQGEAAKALAARARVFELALPLGPTELEEARRAYPDIDGLSGGIGRALATSGREARPPAAPAAEQPPEDASAPAEEPDATPDRLLVASMLGGVCSLAAVLILLATGNFEQPKPPTIADQAAKARRDGAAGPRVIVDSERADFRDSGEPAYFYVFSGRGAKGPRSDELQIWERRGDELVRAFRFEPREVAPGQVALFQFRHIGDVDGDGADELVGGYGTSTTPGALLLPFAVDWNDDADRYELISLAPHPAPLATRARGDDVERLRADYAKRLNLRDVSEERLALGGYRSQDFTVTTKPARLVSAYVVDISRDASTRRVELAPQDFVRTGGLPRVSPCKLTDTGTLAIRVPAARVRLLHLSTLERWLELTRDRSCVGLR